MIAHYTPNGPIPSTTGTVPPGGSVPHQLLAHQMRASLDALSLLLEEDDQFFSEQLPDFKTAQLGPHADLLWHPRVFARLCGLSDAWFTATVLTLAQPEYLGLDLLFDDRLLPRLATMRNGHLRGTFLPYARRIKGFDARDFLRELRRTQQARRPTVPPPAHP